MTAQRASLFPEAKIPENVSTPVYVLHNAAKRYGARTALINASTGECMNYSNLVIKTRKLASGLHRRFEKIQYRHDQNQRPFAMKKPVVCVCARSRMEYAIIVHAVLVLGATVCTVDHSLSTDELFQHFEVLLPDVIIAEDDKLDDVKFAAVKVGCVKEIFVLGSHVRGYISINELANDDGGALPSDIDINYKDDVAIVSFDSSDSEEPRAVMHSHHSFNANIAILSCLSIAPFSHDDVILCCHPMSSMVGLTFYCGLAIREGATMVILPRYSNDGMLDAIAKYQVTTVHVTTVAAEYLATSPAVSNANLNSLRRAYNSSPPVKEGIIGAVMARTGVSEFREAFSPSEAPAALAMPRGDTLPGYVGTVCPNTTVKVVDILFGGIVEPDTYGEICIYGPQITKGHMSKTDSHADQIQEGWLHTGHLGRIEGNGNFTLLGKIQDLIEYNSFQISPLELERVIRQHPEVTEVTVVGVNSPSDGQVPRAYVTRTPEADIIEADIYEYVADRVHAHKRLRGGVVFIDELPKSATGEIQRRKLQEEANKASWMELSMGQSLWPPQDSYLEDMRMVQAREEQLDRRRKKEKKETEAETESPSEEEDSPEKEEEEEEEEEEEQWYEDFTSLSAIGEMAGKGAQFSHPSVQFDGSVDGFITTRTAAREQRLGQVAVEEPLEKKEHTPREESVPVLVGSSSTKEPETVGTTPEVPSAAVVDHSEASEISYTGDTEESAERLKDSLAEQHPGIQELLDDMIVNYQPPLLTSTPKPNRHAANSQMPPKSSTETPPIPSPLSSSLSSYTGTPETTKFEKKGTETDARQEKIDAQSATDSYCEPVLATVSPSVKQAPVIENIEANTVTIERGSILTMPSAVPKKKDESPIASKTDTKQNRTLPSNEAGKTDKPASKVNSPVNTDESEKRKDPRFVLEITPNTSTGKLVTHNHEGSPKRSLSRTNSSSSSSSLKFEKRSPATNSRSPTDADAVSGGQTAANSTIANLSAENIKLKLYLCDKSPGRDKHGRDRHGRTSPATVSTGSPAQPRRRRPPDAVSLGNDDHQLASLQESPRMSPLANRRFRDQGRSTPPIRRVDVAKAAPRPAPPGAFSGFSDMGALSEDFLPTSAFAKPGGATKRKTDGLNLSSPFAREAHTNSGGESMPKPSTRGRPTPV